MYTIKEYGADERIFTKAKEFREEYPARVISQYGKIYRIVTEAGEAFAEVSGKFRYEAKKVRDFPATGDYVMVDRLDDSTGNAIISHVFPRKSVFERTAVGMAEETQIVAANMDIVFLCMALSQDFNLSRLERYLSIAWSSGATPIVLLTKADLCDNLPEKTAETEAVAIGAEVIAVSSTDERSWQTVMSYLPSGVTAVFIGSSGVGKSTLINRLAGKELMRTSAVRQGDDKGRHTTTRREMFVLPDGAIVMDTPGMREIGAETAEVSSSFADIEELAIECRFPDCRHETEPGCAVQQAIECGTLDHRRLESYRKLKKEIRYESLSSRQIERDKIQSMVGSFGEMKRIRQASKEKKRR